MGRKSFLRDAAAGKVKTEKSVVKGYTARDTHRGREGEVGNAHTGRGIVRYAPREKGKMSPLLDPCC